MMRTDVNYIKEDWYVFFAFSMSEAQMDPNDSKSSVLDMEVEQVTVTDQHFGSICASHSLVDEIGRASSTSE